MILIELVGSGPRGIRLEFHPRVTVVCGLSREQRQWLLAELGTALTAESTAFQLAVDVGGEPQALTKELAARLGLEANLAVPNVIEPIDLPGAVTDSGIRASVVPASNRDLADTAFENVRRELERAEENVVRIEEELSAVHVATSPVEEQELQDAGVAHQQARERVAELRARRSHLIATQGPTLSVAERLRRARGVRENLQSRLVGLHHALEDPPIEPRLVEQLLIEAQEAAASEPQRIASLALARELFDHWEQVTFKLARAVEHRGPPEWLLSQTRDDLDNAQARFTALSLQEREGIDVGEQLERAKRQLKDAKEAWDELQRAVSEDPDLARKDVEDTYRRITELLGFMPADELVAEELHGYIQNLSRDVDPRGQLAELLLQARLPTPPEEAIATAVKWLDVCRGNLQRRPQLQQEIAVVALNMQDVGDEISQLEAQVAETGEEAEIDPLGRLNAEIAEAERAALIATERVTALRDRRARHTHRDESAIARLEFRHREALDQVEILQRRVAELERTSSSMDLVESSSTSISSTPWWEGGASVPAERVSVASADLQADVSGVLDEDAELFVLARAASLRRVARGESVPLLIDAAFDELVPAVAARVFDVLPRIAPIVQIVYLASNDVSEKWARRQSEMIAATVRVEGDLQRWSR